MAELITLSFQGLPKRIEQFNAMRVRALDMRPVFELGHTMFMTEEAAQFQSQGAYLTGQPWQPLSPKYAARRLHEIQSYLATGAPTQPFGILRRTGRLLGSLVQSGSPEHVNVIQLQSAAYGSTVPYGIFHQRGSARLPQRIVIKVRKRFAQLLKKAQLAYLLSGRTPGAGA